MGASMAVTRYTHEPYRMLFESNRQYAIQSTDRERERESVQVCVIIYISLCIEMLLICGRIKIEN